MAKHLKSRRSTGRHRHRKYLYRRLAYIQTIAATLLAAGLVGSSLSLDSALNTSANASSFQQSRKVIAVKDNVISRPYAFVASDGSNPTTYMPIWYIGKALESLGISQSWNGLTNTWTLATPGGTQITGLSVGSGQASIVINGQTVKHLNFYTAPDPAAGPKSQPTVYMPIYYVQEILRAAGINSGWDGQTWQLSAAPLAEASDGLSASSPVLFGFVTDYIGSTASLSDLESHPDVTAFATPTYSFTANGGLSGQLYAAAGQYASSNHLNAFVTISNYSNSLGNFDGKMAEQLLNNSADTTALINHMVSLIQNTPFEGINVDFEMLPEASQGAFVQFLGELSKQLHQNGKTLNVDVPGVTNGNSGYDYAGIGKVADDVIVMAYDYSYPGGPAGAIAPLWWVKDVASYAVTNIPANRVLLGIPMYGYDWHSGTTTALSLSAVDNILSTHNITPKWDTKDDTPYFTYTTTGTGGSTTHTVYYENQKSLTDKLDVARQYGLRGVALWHMGLEDSAAWNAVAAYANQP